MTDAGSRSVLSGNVTGFDDELLRLALDASPAGALILGPVGTIVFANRAIQEQFGFSRDQLIGRPPEILGQHLGAAIQAAHANPADGQSRPLRLRNIKGRHRDGAELWLDLSFEPQQRDEGLYLIVALANVTAQERRQRTEQRLLRESLEFERLVSELSATFVNLDPDQVDAEIQQAQRRICEALDLDRATLSKLVDGDLVMTHNWARVPEPPTPSRVSSREMFPWSWARILKGEVVAFSSPDEIPDPIERETVRYYNTKSRIALPLRAAGRVVGSIGFAATRAPRQWTTDLVDRLQLLAHVFANAMMASGAAVALRESEERFHRVADDAPVLIWIAGPDKMCTWLNRQWLEFVGRPLEQELGNGWTTNVHPEDVTSTFRIYEDAFEARRPFMMEYRLRRHDGEWRWIIDQGRPNYAADGTFLGYLGSCVDLTEEKAAKITLQQTLAEVQRLRDELHTENVYLRHEVQERVGGGPIVGRSAALRRVLQQVEQVAATDSTVLLLGETGCGKELFASEIHARSARRSRTMVRVNCAAIPATLIESELFGREKGAYTGAFARQAGRFELADHSTIFLDEIGDLPQEVQVKLLRVLEERQIERLGSTKSTRIDTRIIAATHRNLEQRVREGLFREDLFYRLNVFPIEVPPLRARIDDIPLLVWRFVEEFSSAFSKPIESISKENMQALQRHPWPGNVRELRNAVERAMIVTNGPRLTIPVPATPVAHDSEQTRLEDVEREHIRRVLESSAWRVRGAGGAAARLGLKPTTLETRMAKLGLRRPRA